ncbi:MAG TPA: hypothetical protein VD731_04285 [Nitrosopumilaceae archaeon]|nr:hypothetical protein [Nitrosopumilaceae archaeon]
MLTMRQYNVKVICKHCHRINVFEIIKMVSEDEVRKNGICETCGIKGGLVYLSSLDKKRI